MAMNKKKFTLVLLFLLGLSTISLHASVTQDLKLRFFEGIREEKAEPPRSVTSSYLQSTVTASMESKYLLAEEQEQIKRVFNLKDVRLITEADLSWRSEDPEKIFHIFRLDSKEYLVTITPPDRISKHQFKVEVFEQSDRGKNNLLDTEITLPEKNIAVFGFEDLQGHPYFLSFHVPEKVYGGVYVGVVGGVLGGVSKEKAEEEVSKEAVRAVGEVKPPRLIKKVNAIYPEEARKERVQGVVILEAQTDKSGNVEHVRVLKSNAPLLNEAAMDAVKQWKYEPMFIKGKPTGIIFTVTVRFALKEEETEEFDKVAVIAGEDKEIKPPKLLNKVDPIYPEEAREARVQGVVILRVRVNEEGLVEQILVIKSESEMLNKPAMDAVRQWKYEPLYIEGKPTPVVFNVTVIFRLK